MPSKTDLKGQAMNTPMTIHQRNKSKGIGLIELLIAVGIIGAIVLVALQMGGNMRTDSTVRNEGALLGTVAENIRGLYGTSANFSGLTQQVARDAKLFPGQMDDGTSVFNTWGGAVTIAATADLAANANRAFTVTWAS